MSTQILQKITQLSNLTGIYSIEYLENEGKFKKVQTSAYLKKIWLILLVILHIYGDVDFNKEFRDPPFIIKILIYLYLSLQLLVVLTIIITGLKYESETIEILNKLLKISEKNRSGFKEFISYVLILFAIYTERLLYWFIRLFSQRDFSFTDYYKILRFVQTGFTFFLEAVTLAKFLLFYLIVAKSFNDLNQKINHLFLNNTKNCMAFIEDFKFLNQLAKDINKIFSCNLLILIGFYFYFIVIRIIQIYGTLILEETHEYHTRRIVEVFCVILKVWFVISVSQKCVNQVLIQKLLENII